MEKNKQISAIVIACGWIIIIVSLAYGLGWFSSAWGSIKNLYDQLPEALPIILLLISIYPLALFGQLRKYRYSIVNITGYWLAIAAILVLILPVIGVFWIQ